MAVDIQNKYGYFGVCCLTSSLREGANNGKRKWAVRINKLKRWVDIGICQIRQVHSHKFLRRSWLYTGHGHYCLHSDGSAYSHSDANANNTYILFKFKKGDELQFCYDLVMGKLVVTKINGERY